MKKIWYIVIAIVVVAIIGWLLASHTSPYGNDRGMIDTGAYPDASSSAQ